MKKGGEGTEKTYIEGVRINFLYVDKYSFGRAWYMPESKIPYSMLRYITAGKAIFIIDGKELVVEKNQVVYLPRGCVLSCPVMLWEIHSLLQAYGLICLFPMMEGIF